MAKPEFQGQIPFFLQNFLSRPATSIPKGGQWVLVFEGAEDNYSDQGTTNDTTKNDVIPVKAIVKGTKYEPKKWNIESAIAATLYTDYQEKKGCMFVQAVQIPGENNQINPEGLQQSGYIRTFTGGGRDSFQNLLVSFLETNVSFADNVIRPWIIATSHLGMIARQGSSNYRCNISIYKLGVISQESTPYVTQKYTFYGACPVSVTGEEYSYVQTTNVVNREASFTYHYYTVETDDTNLAINEQKLELQRSRDVAEANIAAYQKNVNILRSKGGDSNTLKALALEARIKAEQRKVNNVNQELKYQERIQKL